LEVGSCTRIHYVDHIVKCVPNILRESNTLEICRETSINLNIECIGILLIYWIEIIRNGISNLSHVSKAESINRKRLVVKIADIDVRILGVQRWDVKSNSSS
jgi:hypothetical protein